MGLEARVPCPVCRGPIHPVAGRCKHCKTDLAAMRAGKPQEAPGALPSLGNRTSNDRPVAGPRSTGRRASARGAMPDLDPSLATFSMGSRIPSSNIPVGRPASIPPAWPVIVIALASLAIVFSLAALMF